MNGKLDLLEAQAVNDLISSQTTLQHQQALHQLQGRQSSFYQRLRKQLIDLLAQGQAIVQFEDDQIDLKDSRTIESNCAKRVAEIITQIRSFLDDNRVGEVIREGVDISIIGPPNSGKSSLLNSLSKSDVAIVSNTPGTTRDIVTQTLKLGQEGILAHLHDTAGLRESTDEIEEIGIERAKLRARKSHLVVWVFDASDLYLQEETGTVKIKIQAKQTEFEAAVNQHEQMLILINKIDLDPKLQQTHIKEMHFLLRDKKFTSQVFLISCKTRTFLDEMIQGVTKKLEKMLNFGQLKRSANPIITRERHRTHLQKCITHLQNYLRSDTLIEIRVEELRYAVQQIGKLTGVVDAEEVLDSLFRQFCIGK